MIVCGGVNNRMNDIFMGRMTTLFDSARVQDEK